MHYCFTVYPYWHYIIVTIYYIAHKIEFHYVIIIIKNMIKTIIYFAIILSVPKYTFIFVKRTDICNNFYFYKEQGCLNTLLYNE